MEWLIPLKSKGYSGAYNVNFLVEEDNIYFSDNHRTALWCWMQHIKNNDNVTVFHIDRHYDTLSNEGAYQQNFPGIFNLGDLQDYLDLEVRINNNATPLIRWDNYLTFFIEDQSLKNNIDAIYLATHKDGTKPKNPHNHYIHETAPYKLVNELKDAFENHDNLIINIDLDYFFTGESNSYVRFIDDETIFEISNTIKNNNGKIKCLTICLSPECCGGWGNAKIILEKITTKLNTTFNSQYL